MYLPPSRRLLGLRERFLNQRLKFKHSNYETKEQFTGEFSLSSLEILGTESVKNEAKNVQKIQSSGDFRLFQAKKLTKN